REVDEQLVADRLRANGEALFLLCGFGRARAREWGRHEPPQELEGEARKGEHRRVGRMDVPDAPRLHAVRRNARDIAPSTEAGSDEDGSSRERVLDDAHGVGAHAANVDLGTEDRVDGFVRTSEKDRAREKEEVARLLADERGRHREAPGRLTSG